MPRRAGAEGHGTTHLHDEQRGVRAVLQARRRVEVANARAQQAGHREHAQQQWRVAVRGAALGRGPQLGGEGLQLRDERRRDGVQGVGEVGGRQQHEQAHQPGEELRRRLGHLLALERGGLERTQHRLQQAGDDGGGGERGGDAGLRAQRHERGGGGDADGGDGVV
tara:strand:- start:55 stop:552 length:498 start_codon:yes stop_codon:yes gene_type:complete